MRRQFLALTTALAGAVLVAFLVPLAVMGQGPATASKTKAWTPPRTVDGHPDLQGVWANNVATPLQRPKSLEGKTVLTDQEVAALKEAAAQLFDGGGDAAFGDQVFETALARAKSFTSTDGKTGDYNHFWLVDRDFDNRTSLITDPPDGRMPPLTPEADKVAKERLGRARGEGDLFAGRADSWEDRGLSERCISFGAPRLGAGYNSYIQIFQARDYVTILQETIHDARIVPLDGRPHLASNVRQWHGDPRGHWEGDTLVVETTNYSPKSALLFFAAGASGSENLRITERMTRVDPKTIKYEVTFSDPSTWTKPWTLMVPLKLANEEMYEYACHEGNTGLAGILAGARAEEKRAAQAGKTGSK
jgi:hypothetical protein